MTDPVPDMHGARRVFACGYVCRVLRCGLEAYWVQVATRRPEFIADQPGPQRAAEAVVSRIAEEHEARSSTEREVTPWSQ